VKETMSIATGASLDMLSVGVCKTEMQFIGGCGGIQTQLAAGLRAGMSYMRVLFLSVI
jgi:hypothetical protein